MVDAGIRVHSVLGPGLLESAYQSCLAFELRKRGLRVEVEKPMPVVYDGHQIDVGYRLDLLVEQRVVVECKSVQALDKIHDAQLLSYLKLGDFRIGLLMNFNVLRLKDGIKRLVNEL